MSTPTQTVITVAQPGQYHDSSTQRRNTVPIVNINNFTSVEHVCTSRQSVFKVKQKFEFPLLLCEKL